MSQHAAARRYHARHVPRRRSRIVKAVALALSLLATLVLSAPAGAVDNGVPDGDRHPNVGLLGFDFDAEGESPPFFLCTGSVLSDRVFLTAAHCIDVFDDTVQWVASLEPGAPQHPAYTPGLRLRRLPVRHHRARRAPAARRSCTRGSIPTRSRTTSPSSCSRAGPSTWRRSSSRARDLLDALSRKPGLADTLLHARRLRRRPRLQRRRAALLRPRLPPDRHRALPRPHPRQLHLQGSDVRRPGRALPRRLGLPAVPRNLQPRRLPAVRRRRHLPGDRRPATR